MSQPKQDVPAPAGQTETSSSTGNVERRVVAGRGGVLALLSLRREIPIWQAIPFSLTALAICFGLWWYVTRGEAEERIYGPLVLPSPAETFKKLPDLWTRGQLLENTYVSLRRVALGFGLAALIGIPIGILCGCFSWVNAFFTPLTIFGRNAPMAALIPLTFALFGSTTEKQKYMFIFLATVAFIISDTAAAIKDVGAHYIDTAYTLGANRRQVILKVLVPLALPGIFSSLRLLFGLAFGYIMLAELVVRGDSAGGLGYILNLAQSRGANRPHILLILIIIPLVALAIDRVLYFIQKQLFPHRYGGLGLLRRALTALLAGLEVVKGQFFTTASAADFAAPKSRSGHGAASTATNSGAKKP
jgi:NitT/TauT family transport system permease protein